MNSPLTPSQPGGKPLQGALESVLYFLGFLVGQLLVTFALLLPYSLAQTLRLFGEGLSQYEIEAELLKRINTEFTPQNTALIGILSALLSVGVLFLVLRKTHPPLWNELGFRRCSLSGFLPVFPMGMGLQIAISLALSLLLLLPALKPLGDQLADYSAAVTGGNKLLELIGVVIAAPLCEEIFFRGAILSSLKRTGLPVWAAIGLQALLFGLVHGLPLQMLYAFVIGLLLGILAQRFSLWHSILLHAMFNACGYWSSLLEREPPLWLTSVLFFLAAVITAASLLLLLGKKSESEKGESHAT